MGGGWEGRELAAATSVCLDAQWCRQSPRWGGGYCTDHVRILGEEGGKLVLYRSCTDDMGFEGDIGDIGDIGEYLLLVWSSFSLALL